MFVEPYRLASLRSLVARGNGLKLLSIFLIGSVGTLTGSAVGMGIRALNADKPAPLVAAAQKPAPAEIELAVEVPVAVAAPVPAAPVPVVAAPKPVVVPKAAPKAVAVKAPVSAPPPVAPAPVAAVPPAPACSADQRMDDAKISWLLQQSAATLAENPSQAAGAARVNADLRGAMGKNLCASEAQKLIASTCTDPAAVKFLNTMVNRLPFFIKPMVGNPCTANLVAVLNKMGKYIS